MKCLLWRTPFKMHGMLPLSVLLITNICIGSLFGLTCYLVFAFTSCLQFLLITSALCS